MGAQLLGEAMSAMFWQAAAEKRPLNPGHRLVLVVMARRALDNPTKRHPGRIYWGGWQILAQEGLNYPDWPDEAAKQAVARAIRDLTDRGLIRLYPVQTRPHRRYEILPPMGPR
jgi:hypothetical protein